MLFAVVALLCLVSVPLAAGRLGLLGDVQFRGIWPAVAGLCVQIVVITIAPHNATWIHDVAHLGSYLLVGWVVWANRHIPWLWLIGVGGLLNFIAISVNGGVMPASEWAREAAGMAAADGAFTNSGVLADPKLAFLGDVFPLPAPWSPNVFSVGDVVMAIGAFLLVHTLSESLLSTRRRRGRGIENANAAVALPAAAAPDPLLRAVVGVVVVGATLASTRGRKPA
jgi:hypothetical protein